jgi:hypothetical protein
MGAYSQDNTCEPYAAPSAPAVFGEIVRLGTRLESQWRAKNYNDTEFSGIAARLLQDSNFHKAFEFGVFVQETLRCQTLPKQLGTRAAFGQPPITIFETPRFYIALLFWVDPTTSIHEHSFDGAFMMLAGSSLHLQYRFLRDEAVNCRLAVGRLERSTTEILRPGSVRVIRCGAAGAHSNFHLDRPTVTLVIRTHTNRKAQPQYTYHWPGIALDPFFVDADLTTKLQLLRLLLLTNRPELDQAVTTLLSYADIETAIRTLLYIRSICCEYPLLLRLARMAAHTHPHFRDHFVALAEALYLENRLSSMTRQVRCPEARLLIAILLNRLSRDEAISLISESGVERPIEILSSSLASLLGDIDGIDTSNEVLRDLLHSLVAFNDVEKAVTLTTSRHDLTSSTEFS